MTAQQDMTPKQIVEALDQHIVGQNRAKRLVALALRSRWRRMRLDPREASEVLPKHILMIGPTGCGKTEIARRIASLTNAPFVKVEATKFTEVGYVGRDVDGIVRDLVDAAIRLVRNEEEEKHRKSAELAARERLISVIVGRGAAGETERAYGDMLDKGEIEDKEIEVELRIEHNRSVGFELPGMSGNVVDLSEMMNRAMGMSNEKRAPRRVSVREARKALIKEELDKRIDDNQISDRAVKRVEERGIVFVDEIDKILETSETGIGRAGVSREGVQRDLLPLIEGTSVNTRYGAVDTRHILFVTAGAFHLAKPTDLIPELQGRLPVRVELEALNADDYLRILVEPKHSLYKQYRALLAVEGVDMKFEKDALERVARYAHELNGTHGNVGARRLFTVMEKLLEDVSFKADEMSGEKISISAKRVDEVLSESVKAGPDNLVIL